MFKTLTIEQFELARKTTAEVRRLIETRDKLLALGKLDVSFALPSVMWEHISLFRYVQYPSFDIVNTWRLHTYPFTGRYLGYSIDNGHNPLPPASRRRYMELTAGLPPELILRPPEILGEIGWEIDGGIVNDDVLMYQGHLTALFESGAIDYLRNKSAIRVLEIGAGYGGLAFGIWKALNPRAFHIVDLPESLIYSAVYLPLACGVDEAGRTIYDASKPAVLSEESKRFVFLPNFLISELKRGQPYDLVINTGSFGEMSAEQVSMYADALVHLLSPDGLLYEHNQNTWVPVSGILDRHFRSHLLGRARLWAHDETTLSAAIRHKKKRPKSPLSVRSLALKVLGRLQRHLDR